MKKFLSALFSLTALAAMLPAASNLTREAVITHLDSCEAILQEIQGNAKTAIPADILHRAKGLVIVNQFQAGFFLGIKDGYAVALVRRPNGKWSVPAFLKAGELSFGLQVGGKSITAVYVLMDDETSRLLLKNRMNLTRIRYRGLVKASRPGPARRPRLQPAPLRRPRHLTPGFRPARAKTHPRNPHSSQDRRPGPFPCSHLVTKIPLANIMQHAP